MFYTPNTLTVSAGQEITGSLSCAPNARNNRDLDITIAFQTEGEDPSEVHYKMCVIPSPFLPLDSAWNTPPAVDG